MKGDVEQKKMPRPINGYVACLALALGKRNTEQSALRIHFLKKSLKKSERQRIQSFDTIVGR